jgi:hypothetical protein
MGIMKFTGYGGKSGSLDASAAAKLDCYMTYKGIAALYGNSI